MSVRWLLESQVELSKQGKRVHIVPVMISYDRIYEQNNLPSEMMSEQTKKYNIYTVLERMTDSGKDSLG